MVVELEAAEREERDLAYAAGLPQGLGRLRPSLCEPDDGRERTQRDAQRQVEELGGRDAATVGRVPGELGQRDLVAGQRRLGLEQPPCGDEVPHEDSHAAELFEALLLGVRVERDADRVHESENRLLVVEIELRQQEARVVCRGGEFLPRARRDQLPVFSRNVRR